MVSPVPSPDFQREDAGAFRGYGGLQVEESEESCAKEVNC